MILMWRASASHRDERERVDPQQNESPAKASAKSSRSAVLIPRRAPSCRHFATAAATSPMMASQRVDVIRKYAASERNAAREASGPVLGEIQVFSSETRSGKGLRSNAGARRHCPWATCRNPWLRKWSSTLLIKIVNAIRRNSSSMSLCAWQPWTRRASTISSQHHCDVPLHEVPPATRRGGVTRFGRCSRSSKSPCSSWR